MLQQRAADLSWEGYINQLNKEKPVQEVKSYILKLWQTAKDESQASDLNTKAEDAALLTKLEKSKPSGTKQKFNLKKLKSQLIIEFQNFYPFKKFEIEVADAELVELDKLLFTRGVKKLVNLAIQESNELKAEVIIYRSNVDIIFRSLKLTKKEFEMLQKGMKINDEPKQIEALPLRLMVAKRLIELAGGSFELRLNKEFELEAAVACSNEAAIKMREVA